MSISPTFYKLRFCTKGFRTALMCLQFGFCIFFWQKEIGAKAACKILGKLTTYRRRAFNTRKKLVLIRTELEIKFHFQESIMNLKEMMRLKYISSDHISALSFPREILHHYLLNASNQTKTVMPRYTSKPIERICILKFFFVKYVAKISTNKLCFILQHVSTLIWVILG